MRVFAEVVANDIEELAHHYGYSINIQQIGDSFVLFLVYPYYHNTIPLRIMTFNSEFTKQDILNNTDAANKIIEVINRNNNKHVVHIQLTKDKEYVEV